VSEDRIKELMQELLKELEADEAVGNDTVEIARRLETDIHDLVNPETDSSENTIMDDAIALEASFAARYPVAERIVRELINNLSRIGI
jgi:hypothetical protein